MYVLWFTLDILIYSYVSAVESYVWNAWKCPTSLSLNKEKKIPTYDNKIILISRMSRACYSLYKSKISILAVHHRVLSRREENIVFNVKLFYSLSKIKRCDEFENFNFSLLWREITQIVMKIPYLNSREHIVIFIASIQCSNLKINVVIDLATTTEIFNSFREIRLNRIFWKKNHRWRDSLYYKNIRANQQLR